MLINKPDSFDPAHTFECGQCFRWNCDDKGVYTGISGGKICRVEGQNIICKDEDFLFWKNYFAIDTNYLEIKDNLLKMDSSLTDCVNYGSGIRILKQDIWETIISFIISANNNIPRIKRIIETMCQLFGEKIETEEEVFYAFPSPGALAKLKKEDLALLKVGYRDVYILDAAQKVFSGEVDIDKLPDMTDSEAKTELMKIKGVGGKVADCILLFALQRFSVFPTDVWIKRILADVYGIDEKNIMQFVSEKYKSLAGFAQQYLYYYYRNNI